MCQDFSHDRSWKRNYKVHAEELDQAKESPALVPVSRRLCPEPSWLVALAAVPVGLRTPLPVPDGSLSQSPRAWQPAELGLRLLQEMAAFEGWPFWLYDFHTDPHTPLSQCQRTPMGCRQGGPASFRCFFKSLGMCPAFSFLNSLSLQTIVAILPEPAHYLNTEWFLLLLIPLEEGREDRAMTRQGRALPFQLFLLPLTISQIFLGGLALTIMAQSKHESVGLEQMLLPHCGGDSKDTQSPTEGRAPGTLPRHPSKLK